MARTHKVGARPPQLDDQEWLLKRYVVEGASQLRIAEELQCGPTTVKRALERHGIQTSGRGGLPTVRPGDRYGYLTVLRQVGKRGNGHHRTYLCRCDYGDCGNETRVGTTDLRSGHTRSCGCLRRETSKDAVVVALSRATGQRNVSAVRDAARRLGQFTVAELAEATGLHAGTVRRHLRVWERKGAVRPPVYEWAYDKPTGVQVQSAARKSKRRDYSGAGPSGRMQLPPDKEMRKVVRKYATACRALANGYYEATLPNGQTVKLASTPTNSTGAARSAEAEIRRLLEAA